MPGVWPGSAPEAPPRILALSLRMAAAIIRVGCAGRDRGLCCSQRSHRTCPGAPFPCSRGAPPPRPGSRAPAVHRGVWCAGEWVEVLRGGNEAALGGGGHADDQTRGSHESGECLDRSAYVSVQSVCIFPLCQCDDRHCVWAASVPLWTTECSNESSRMLHLPSQHVSYTTRYELSRMLKLHMQHCDIRSVTCHMGLNIIGSSASRTRMYGDMVERMGPRECRIAMCRYECCCGGVTHRCTGQITKSYANVGVRVSNSSVGNHMCVLCTGPPSSHA